MSEAKKGLVFDPGADDQVLINQGGAGIQACVKVQMRRGPKQASNNECF